MVVEFVAHVSCLISKLSSRETLLLNRKGAGAINCRIRIVIYCFARLSEDELGVEF